MADMGHVTESKTYIPKAPCCHGHMAPRYKSNNGCSECLRLGSRKYYRENAESLSAKARDRAKENPEKNNRQSADWAKNNPNKIRAMSANSKAKSRGCLRKITEEDALFVLSRDSHRCLACGGERGIVVDHIVPLAMGGDNARGNLQTLCIACNQSKGSRHSTDYRREEHAQL